MAITPNTTFVSGAILTAAQQNNFPRGLMGYVSKTDGNFTFSSEVDITGMSISFTGIANRLYRISTGIVAQKTTNSGTVYITAKDTSNNVLNQTGGAQTAGSDLNLSTNFVITATGSTTIRLTAQASSASGLVYANAFVKATFIIEDIGGI